MDILQEMSLNKDFLTSINDDRKYNRIIKKYFFKFANNEGYVAFNKDTLINNAKAIENCNKVWTLDFYKNSNVKEILRTMLCRNKFCANCKKVAQATRMSKYIPLLSNYSSKLYHLTLTLPNVNGVSLRSTLKKMSRCFKRLVNFLKGYKHISGLDFDWGFEGCIRSLEVTFNGDNYHPHYHVAVVFSNIDISSKNIENVYSYNFKNGFAQLTRLFSEQEILIQKIWYLLLNDIKVTKFSIDNLDVGYSCSMDHFVDDHYVELFKYMTKSTSENGNVLTYNNFISLYYSLYRIKQLQGYGCFYDVIDDFDTESAVQAYSDFINSLKLTNDVLRINEFTSIDDKKTYIERKSLLFDDSNVPIGLVNLEKSVYVSRKKFFQYLKKI